MIFKFYELNKIDLKNIRIFLIHGKNDGAKNAIISHIKRKDNESKKIKYTEKEILNQNDEFYNIVLNKSFFEEKKIIIVDQVTSKIKKILEDISDKISDDIYLVILSDPLDKKSALRSDFEKNKNHACIAVYPENEQTMMSYASNFFSKNKISISNANINMIVNKCSNDIENLKNELNKIELYLKDKKNITSEEILRLTNLIENHSFYELVNNCLALNNKKTVNILNENNYSNEDTIIIIRTFLSKAKQLNILAKEFENSKNIDSTIAKAKPPIFWKDKETTKLQIKYWTQNKIKKLLDKINETELLIKKNSQNSLQILFDFILNIKINNEI